jgi:hypothetical protein
LDCLRAYGAAQSEHAEYRRKLDHVEILASKKLEKDALIYLRHLKNEVIKKTYSKGNSHLADMLEVESWLIERTDSANIVVLQELMKENLDNSQEMYLTNHLLYNYTRLGLMAMNKLALRSNDDKEEFINLKHEMKLWENKVEENEPFNRFLYLSDAKANLALLNADFEKYHFYTYKIWQRFSTPQEVEGFIHRKSLVFYAGAFINAARGCVLAKKKAELKNMIEKAKPVYKNHLTEDDFHFSYFLYFQMMLAQLEGNKNTLTSSLNLLQKLSLWQQESPNIPQHRTFATGMAVAYYSIDDYKNALKWARKATELHPHKTAEMLTHEFCSLFSFITEYDLLNTEKENEPYLIEFSTRAEAYIDVLKKQNEKDFRFSISVLRFLIKAARINDTDKRLPCAKILQSEIAELKNVQNVKQFYALFDFDRWVEDKIK